MSPQTPSLLRGNSEEEAGLLDGKSRGTFPSWRESIASLENRKIPYDWETLMEKTFLDKSRFDRYRAQMLELLECCPEERHLVHRDFGFDNLILDQGRVTGVLDWAESRMGDPLYDVGWLCFWSEGVLEILPHFQAPQPEFAKRLLCYTLHVGLSGMLIFTHLKDESAYKNVIQRIEKCWNIFS